MEEVTTQGETLSRLEMEMRSLTGDIALILRALHSSGVGGDSGASNDGSNDPSGGRGRDGGSGSDINGSGPGGARDGGPHTADRAGSRSRVRFAEAVQQESRLLSTLPQPQHAGPSQYAAPLQLPAGYEVQTLPSSLPRSSSASSGVSNATATTVLGESGAATPTRLVGGFPVHPMPTAPTTVPAATATRVGLGHKEGFPG